VEVGEGVAGVQGAFESRKEVAGRCFGEVGQETPPHALLEAAEVRVEGALGDSDHPGQAGHGGPSPETQAEERAVRRGKLVEGGSQPREQGAAQGPPLPIDHARVRGIGRREPVQPFFTHVMASDPWRELKHERLELAA
jgi:hypothetical protein